MAIEIVKGSPLSERQLAKTQEFLGRLGLDWEKNPDTTVNVFDGTNIVATGSRHRNVLKCIGASCRYRGEGLATKVATELVKDALENGHDHLFVYTKPENIQTFSELGFYLIVSTGYVAFMENRKDGIKNFVSSFNVPERKGNIGGIVANCNPFTNGHLYLMEQAASTCDHVYIFVLSEDVSEFSAKDRLELVKRGTAHIKNLSVFTTGNYLVSMATFPQYFLKDKADINLAHCELDVKIFAEYFAKPLGINRRYIGTEPFSPITDAYNTEMKNGLPDYGISVIELPRKEDSGGAVSASRVRKLIADKNFNEISQIVPPTTYEFIMQNFSE